MPSDRELLRQALTNTAHAPAPSGRVGPSRWAPILVALVVVLLVTITGALVWVWLTGLRIAG